MCAIKRSEWKMSVRCLSIQKSYTFTGNCVFYYWSFFFVHCLKKTFIFTHNQLLLMPLLRLLIIVSKKKNENFNIYTNIVQTLQGECRKFLFDNIIEYKCILYRMLWHYGTIGTRQSDATHIVHFECCKTSLGSFYCGQFVVHVCRNFLCFCFQFFWFRCECSMRLHC